MVIAVGAVDRIAALAVPDQLDGLPVDRQGARAGLGRDRHQVVEIGHARLVDAERAHAVVGEVALEPGRVSALRYPEATAPGAEARDVRANAGGELQAQAGVRGEQRQHGVRGGRRPQLDAVERAERAEQVPVVRLEGPLGERVVAGGTPDLGGQRPVAAAFEPGGVLLVDRCAHIAQEAQVALARVALHRLELVAQHGRQPDGHGRAVEQLEQWQVNAGDGLPQPLLAERPRAEPLDVGHVRVQDERERAGSDRRVHGRRTATKSSARSSAARPQGEVARRDRRREAVVERLGDPAAPCARGPSRRAVRARERAARGRGRARGARPARTRPRTAAGTPPPGTRGCARGCPTSRPREARASAGSGSTHRRRRRAGASR